MLSSTVQFNKKSPLPVDTHPARRDKPGIALEVRVVVVVIVPEGRVSNCVPIMKTPTAGNYTNKSGKSSPPAEKWALNQL